MILRKNKFKLSLSEVQETLYLRFLRLSTFFLFLRLPFLFLRLSTFFTVALACLVTAVPTFWPKPRAEFTTRPLRLKAERPTLRLASIRWCIGEYTRRNNPLDFLVLPLAISILLIEYLSNPLIQIAPLDLDSAYPLPSLKLMR